jgi:microtubule-associated protein-like 6
VLLQGHFGSELHGLCAHPSAPEFVTVGDDRMLRIWNIRDRKVRLTYN